jgi:hypothetical protein
MEWFTDDPRRGQAALTVIALAIAAAIVALWRKRLLWAIPCAFIWLLLAAMAIPSYMAARPIAHRNACINNLRMILDAKAQWAKENHKPAGEVIPDGTLYGTSGTNGILGYRPICPDGGTYTIGAVSQQPACSLASKGHRLE